MSWAPLLHNGSHCRWRGQSRSGLSSVAACLEAMAGIEGLPGKNSGVGPAPGEGELLRGLVDTLSVGERIAWYRQRCGMSQEVLAGLVGRTADWLSKIENNRIDLDRLSVLQSLASALDVRVGDLIGEPLLLDWSAEVAARRCRRCEPRYGLPADHPAPGPRADRRRPTWMCSRAIGPVGRPIRIRVTVCDQSAAVAAGRGPVRRPRVHR